MGRNKNPRNQNPQKLITEMYQVTRRFIFILFSEILSKPHQSSFFLQFSSHDAHFLKRVYGILF